ncbi:MULTISPECIES: GAF domain-containing protein [unclassified Streptomyces]|uniref:GAF domain-containing protein n=1 Tax=unclassified Streptomyces TaxID=2593676 RepID=UPI001BE6AFF1|nr:MULTISPECIES: GAF domain-containing protein [unclassified Streptomyces]MBT2408255.1 GAF domain-containing protein [Streptomyces sp. ISL-21]MBT2455317.1 GAF domain-containing protein [Streptomyces sp. ISL-86]MBT2607468.1 GAF domain-containing protein [Streptomyces sp. ISL-87]
MSEAANAIETWLRQWISAHGGVAGTVHLRRGDDMTLAAAVNIPPPVVAIVGVVPKGKGMAGLAFERDVPVSTCNLKTDTTGDVRPGAKAVDANAAVAIPVHDAAGEIRGVVGIAYRGERAMDDGELALLTREAEAVPAA